MMTWDAMRDLAEDIKLKDGFLAPILDKYILKHNRFGLGLAMELASRFEGDVSRDQWFSLLKETIKEFYEDEGMTVEDTCFTDLVGITTRDPACDGLVHAFLNFKGFQALASHRMAHVLWRQGRKEVAVLIQSRCAQVFAVDIHPAARIGAGLMIDHATGVVVGETATVGNNCTFLHGVTLGSSGKDRGLRHPQIGNDVLIGCNASILGYIEIGNNCKIGSGSIVLKPIPTNCTAVGNPARIVGKSKETSAAASMDLALHDVFTKDGRLFESTWSMWADGSNIFEEVDTSKVGFISRKQVEEALYMQYRVTPPASVVDLMFTKLGLDPLKGRVTKADYDNMLKLIGLVPRFLADNTEWDEFSQNVSFSSSSL